MQMLTPAAAVPEGSPAIKRFVSVNSIEVPLSYCPFIHPTSCACQSAVTRFTTHIPMIVPTIVTVAEYVFRCDTRFQSFRPSSAPLAANAALIAWRTHRSSWPGNSRLVRGIRSHARRLPPLEHELELPEQVAGDHHPLDLAGALVERGHPRVAVMAFGGELVDVTIAAMHLDRDVAGPVGLLAGEELR